MNDDRILTPGEAESVVDEQIEQFGLGALPRVRVISLDDRRWRVQWQHMERDVEAMTMCAWRAWLGENVGSLDAGDLETTES